jgi:hypothetical protein
MEKSPSSKLKIIIVIIIVVLSSLSLYYFIPKYEYISARFASQKANAIANRFEIDLQLTGIKANIAHVSHGNSTYWICSYMAAYSHNLTYLDICVNANGHSTLTWQNYSDAYGGIYSISSTFIDSYRAYSIFNNHQAVKSFKAQYSGEFLESFYLARFKDTFSNNYDVWWISWRYEGANDDIAGVGGAIDAQTGDWVVSPGSSTP